MSDPNSYINKRATSSFIFANKKLWFFYGRDSWTTKKAECGIIKQSCLISNAEFLLTKDIKNTRKLVLNIEVCLLLEQNK